MSYLNLDLDYRAHPKTRRLVGLLGKGAEVLPIWLWCYAGKFHAKDGKLSGYSAQEIESEVGWWGQRGKMIEAMLQVGFLEPIDNGYQVHDWAEHAGHLFALKSRSVAANRQRWRSISPKEASKESSSDGMEGKEGRSEESESGVPEIPADTVLIGGVRYKWPSPEGLLALSLDPETWNKFVDFRREIHKPLTRHAEKLAGAKLADLWAQGQDLGAVIDQSILNGWHGLFAIKGNGTGLQTKASQQSERIQAARRRGLE